jgi:hypothetical protein
MHSYLLFLFVGDLFLNGDREHNQEQHGEETNPPKQLVDTAVVVVESENLPVVDVTTRPPVHIQRVEPEVQQK